MRTISKRWFVACSLASAVGCTPRVSPLTGGNGGTGGTSSSTSGSSTAANMTGSSTTGAGTTVSSTVGTTSSASSTTSTSTGMPPELQLYQHAYPFNTMGAVWTKSPITAVLGAGAPTANIISAVKLEKTDVLYILTSDETMHYLHAGAWSSMPIDTMFPVPAVNQDNGNPCNPSNPMGPPAVKVSTDPALYMFHVPGTPGVCGATKTAEGITLLGKTYGTSFDVNLANFTGTYQVQRQYHVDCYPDAYGPTVYALWGFNYDDAAACGNAAWYQTFAWYSDGMLRNTGGASNGPWSATDPNNPIFKTPAPANQPDPNAIVAAYFTQDANPQTGTAVFIAP